MWPPFLRTLIPMATILFSTQAWAGVPAEEGDDDLAVKPEQLEGTPRTKEPAPPTPTPTPPENASAALTRAAAAYEYGDMNQLVEAARPIADGQIPATQEERAEAFRLLGIGLFLNGRPMGAENAFTELLTIHPKAWLDPTATRPELVSFFEEVRRKVLLSQRRLAWNFLPPAGQFQNGDRTTGWILLGVEVASLTTMIGTRIVDVAWRRQDNTSTHEELHKNLRVVNLVTPYVLGAAVLYGIVDGLVGYYRPLGPKRISFRSTPEGGGFGFTF